MVGLFKTQRGPFKQTVKEHSLFTVRDFMLKDEEGGREGGRKGKNEGREREREGQRMK